MNVCSASDQSVASCPCIQDQCSICALCFTLYLRLKFNHTFKHPLLIIYITYIRTIVLIFITTFRPRYKSSYKDCVTPICKKKTGGGNISVRITRIGSYYLHDLNSDFLSPSLLLPQRFGQCALKLHQVYIGLGNLQ